MKRKFWIMGREEDKQHLESLGVKLGPKQRNETGQVIKAGTKSDPLVVWGLCEMSIRTGLELNKFCSPAAKKPRYVYGEESIDRRSQRKRLRAVAEGRL